MNTLTDLSGVDENLIPPVTPSSSLEKAVEDRWNALGERLTQTFKDTVKSFNGQYPGQAISTKLLVLFDRKLEQACSFLLKGLRVTWSHELSISQLVIWEKVRKPRSKSRYQSRTKICPAAMFRFEKNFAQNNFYAPVIQLPGQNDSNIATN